MDYNFKEVESKWQGYWEKEEVFKTDINNMEDPFYILNMFPYPSGDKLHMGHWF